jgi:hypothetical protein
MPTKSFRGLIADGTIETVSLHTNDGSVGYKITKLELIANQPGIENYEHVVKIYKIPQTSVDGIIDFSDNTLLASAYLEGSTSTTTSDNLSIIFDNEIFNQDIFITHSEVTSTDPGAAVNYYFELEQIKLSLDENTVSTLKDIRNIEANKL